MFHWNKKSLESSRLQEQRTSCKERKERKGNTLTTMLISSFANWSCIPESWVCVICSLASVAVITEYMQSETCLSPQHLCEAREALLPPFAGREVTARRHKCGQALHLRWGEREPACRGSGGKVREGTGWSRVLPVPSCPSAQHTAHLQALPFWEQNTKTSCHSPSPAEISISLCCCSPSRAVHGRQRIRLQFKWAAPSSCLYSWASVLTSRSHVIPRACFPPPNFTCTIGGSVSLCIRCTQSRILTSAGCSCNTDSRQLYH